MVSLFEVRYSKIIMAARCIVKTAKRKSYLQVTNPTDKEITIPYQYMLASVSDIDVSNIQKLEQSKKQNIQLITCQTTMNIQI